METIFLSTEWLVFISIFSYFVQTLNKDGDNITIIIIMIIMIIIIIIII